MDIRKINYYGYEKAIYNDCKDQIRRTNLRHAFILNTWFFLVTLVFMIFRINDAIPGSKKIFPQFNMNGLDRAVFSPIYIFVIFFVLALLFEVYLVSASKWHFLNVRVIPYISIFLIGFFAMFVGLVQSSKPAIMFPVVIVLVSGLFIDTMVCMMFSLILLNILDLLPILYGISFWSLSAKPASIANEDIFYTILFFSLCIVLHFFIQRTRIGQFGIYCKNLQITRELSVKSSFDPLTMVLGRGRFMSMAAEAMRLEHNEYMVLILMDIDFFKQINDKLGHQMGDKVLQIVGDYINKFLVGERGELSDYPERTVRDKKPFAGRLGGDEFIIMLRGLENREAARKHIDEFLKGLNEMKIEGLDGVHSSIGLTEISPSESNIDEVYSRADRALYQSKENGRNRISFIGED